MYRVKYVGTDTEVFLKDENGNDIPVVGLVGGTKAEPRKLDEELSAVQEDNVMLEFNTTPAANETEFRDNINKVLVMVIEELRQKHLTINIAPSVQFKANQLLSEQAKQMGCEPDWSAWTCEMNPLLNPTMLGDIRTAGGHIHVSFSVDDDNPTVVQKRNLIRMLDLTLGIPSVLLDDDDRRRKFYGRAGAHRIKADDRVEYRTLSNFWIRNDTLKEWAFNGVVDAVKRLNKAGESYKTTLCNSYMMDRINRIIATSDKEDAKALIWSHNIVMP